MALPFRRTKRFAFYGAAANGDGVAVELIESRRNWENEVETVDEAEVLSDSPYITFWPKFLTRFECAYAIATARRLLRILDVINSGTGKQLESQARISETAWLQPHQLDVIQHSIFQKIVVAFGGILELAEPMSFIRYRPGGVFLAHVDAYKNYSTGELDDSARATTSIVYLNEGYEGGGTAFIEPRLKVTGQTGDMLHFRNLTTDGEVDRTSVHAGMAVTVGEKCVLVQWIRRGL